MDESESSPFPDERDILEGPFFAPMTKPKKVKAKSIEIESSVSAGTRKSWMQQLSDEQQQMFKDLRVHKDEPKAFLRQLGKINKMLVKHFKVGKVTVTLLQNSLMTKTNTKLITKIETFNNDSDSD
jgi:hypothetical protein